VAEEYDFLFKSIVVGDGGVGKTALTLRFSKGFFTEDYKMTIGVDFHVKTIELDTEEGPIRCKLQLWDTGGQERFSSIRPMYYRGSLGAVLVFDLTNPASFEHLPQWIQEVRSNVKTEIPLLLVGNKSDLLDQRKVSIEEINKFTNDFNLYYMETSAKTGDGVGDCFYILACLMIGQGVPEKLIAKKIVYSPGNISIVEPVIPSKTESVKEPQFDYIAPPVPEPPSSKLSVPAKSEQKKQEFDHKAISVPEPTISRAPFPSESLERKQDFDFEAPPVPEPSVSRASLPSESLERKEDFDFEAPPVPEPNNSQIEEHLEIKTPESTDIEFKTPDEILSQIDSKDQKEIKATPFSIPKKSPKEETYKPKSVPFSTKTPIPAPAPDGFQTPSKSSQKEQMSAPFRVTKREEPSKPLSASRKPEPKQEIPSESTSQSLVDYLPQEQISKKEKKRLKKLKKKKEKEEQLKITREKQENLIKAMKKPQKEKKTETKELGSPSLFQALSQRIEESTDKMKTETFIPFASVEENNIEDSSSLRIIPNVADIDDQPSSFTSFTSTLTEEKESEKQDSKELLICKQCGATLSSDYAFCNKCGSKL